ncbi:hypothetical protein DACRYDRAFT_73212 [Dacryopinax primogenitus]|uniref:VWFA domain-containing protein n=1 Tax=Dacryopinax primogenitus (strain DJM 731) TaxID=1858805 RepID=M5GGS3_DACPD|nr:uncharacterized protein DACRYDRAFT_73212 [Dacryopinax primogenitus]EJU05988.1 hypothetical protein DACRYDRAFT_73212 [Dacryopinax primogenitus]
MVLEACMIVIDNSEFMRNGDFQPTRFGAQSDAVSSIFQTKVDSNPENTVGVMTMAGKAPEVLVTPTQDIGKILSALHNTRLGGEADIATGIQVAQLALKHRPNKSQRQRIVVFVGSPVNADEKSLVKLGKKLKKNNIAIDIVNFGEEEENQTKLEEFVKATDSSNNSHLVSVPPGPHLLSDFIFASPMLEGDGAAPRGGFGAGDDFAMDPNMDPELAEALRLSLAEERAREAAVAAAAVSTGEPAITSTQPITPAPPETMDEDELMLQQALALSQSERGPEDHEGDVHMGDEAPASAAEGEEDEEEAIRLAIEMSLKENKEKEEHGPTREEHKS